METVFVENDAVNCYDRIIPVMTETLTQRIVLEMRASKYQTRVLEKFKHHIRTYKGPSKKYFKYEEEYPIYGTGQGTGWSPTIWTALNDVIIRAIYNNGIHIKYTNPTNTIESIRNIDAFVDDTATGATKASIEASQSLIQETKKLLQKYKRYLYIYGGKLAIQNALFGICYSKETKTGKYGIKQ